MLLNWIVHVISGIQVVATVTSAAPVQKQHKERNNKTAVAVVPPPPDFIKSNFNFITADYKSINDEEDIKMQDNDTLIECFEWCRRYKQCKLVWYIQKENCHTCEMYDNDFKHKRDMASFDDMNNVSVIYTRKRTVAATQLNKMREGN